MTVLVDTGVLVALIDPDTGEHRWAQDWAKRLPQPFQTSEPVLTEAAFVLARDGFDADELFALAEGGVIKIGLHFEDERAALRELNCTRTQESSRWTRISASIAATATRSFQC